MKRLLIAGAGIIFTYALSWAQMTRPTIELQQDDSAEVARISAYLMTQTDRSKLPEWSKEWKKFNYTPDMYGESALYKRLGYLPHKTTKELNNSHIGIGFETLDRDTFDPLVTFDYLCEAGVKYARCQTGWWKCERTVGKYDFKWLDDVVDGLAERNIETWFSLSFGHPEYCPCEFFEKQWEDSKKNGTMVPGWGRGWVGEAPYYHGEKAMEAWQKYVRALAKHFKGRVNIFEVWNEPEYFWRKGYKIAGEELYGDVQAAKDFAEFIKITAKELRKVIPDARVTFNSANLSTVWLVVMAKEGIGDVIDFYNYHVYQRAPEDGVSKTFNQAKALFKKKDGSSVAVWQGESGRATDKSGLFAFPSQYNQAKYIARRITYDLSLGCEVTSQFTVADFLCYYPDGSDQFYGIWNTRANKPKLGWYTLQSMCYLMDNTCLAPEYWFNFTTPQNHQTFASLIPYMNVEIAQFSRNGIPLIAFWQKENIDISAAPLNGHMEFVTDAPSLLQHPIVIDPVRGEVWDVKGALGYYRRGIQTLALWAYDYPLFLTDLSFFK